MAVRADFLPHALPFPPGIPMHDQWLGLMAERRKRVRFLREPLLLYRRHGGNASAERPGTPAQMLRRRAALLRALAHRAKEGKP
jgi:hypothetical protein